MSFDLNSLRAAIAEHGAVARVVVAEIAGSVPREPGAAMLIWPGGQSGTIGGGTLEFEALQNALSRLAVRAAPDVTRHALGPALGQCCGGAVTLVTEIFDAATLDALDTGAGMVARPVAPGAGGEAPLAVRRVLNTARATGICPEPLLSGGWLVEPLLVPARSLWVWGAGHVGRALVATLLPFPDLAITWIDTRPERFPDLVPDGVTTLVAANPADLVPYAPHDAEHLILTYSHAMDLELCHRLLGHGFRRAGLIGSASKWARFRGRLGRLGHAPDRIARITCPIGDPSLGKHPQAIAVGVAAALLADREAETNAREARR